MTTNQVPVQTIQMTSSQTPPQAKNPILNATLGPITSNQQPTKTVNFVSNIGQPIVNMVASNVPTSVLGQTLVQPSQANSGIIVNSQPNTHHHRVKHIQGGTPILVSESPIAVTQSQTGAQVSQQVGGIIGGPQITIAGPVLTNAQIVSTQPSVVGQVIQRPVATNQVPQNRQQNLHNIQKLERDLQEAKRHEALFQQQESHVPQIVQGTMTSTSGHIQHHPQQNSLQVIRQPMGTNTVVANQIQHRQIAQQRLSLQQQQQQQQTHQQIIINPPGRQMNVSVGPNNTQALRNILQQQSQPNVLTRTLAPQQSQGSTIGPIRNIRPMIQTQTIHPQQQHMQHQQQQTLMQQQQQPQQPKPQPPQQHNAQQWS